MTRIILCAMWLVHRLPLSMLRRIGGALGLALLALASRRRRIAHANLRACFPAMGGGERATLVRSAFTYLGKGLMDRAVLWHGSRERIRRLVRIEGEAHLLALRGQPVILLAPHFTGLDAGGARLMLDHRISSIYSNQKDPRFNQALLAGRTRFNDSVILSRQEGVRAALRVLKDGLPFYYLPDMDLGERGAVFAPFFGVPAATVTAVSRLARLSGARVLPCITRMTDDGYTMTIDPPWDDFPGTSEVEDATRLNAFIEAGVRAMPAQYHWLHRRFKTRPAGAKRIYD